MEGRVEREREKERERELSLQESAILRPRVFCGISDVPWNSLNSGKSPQISSFSCRVYRFCLRDS